METLNNPVCAYNHVIDKPDPNRVAELSKQLVGSNVLGVLKFGAEATHQTVEYADKLLEKSHVGDIEALGTALGQILEAADSVNFKQKSQIPVIGRIVDRVRVKVNKVQIQGDFISAKAAIDRTLESVEGNRQALEVSIQDMDCAYASILEQYRHLELFIAAGVDAVAQLESMLSAYRMETNDGFENHRIAELVQRREAIAKRTADLTILQQDSVNMLSELRLMQNNSAMLVDKMHTIVQLTIPSWKRRMFHGLMLDQQTSAVKLVQAVDDFTNSVMVSQADQLKVNSIATAKANQRMVIDLDTVIYCQNALVETVTSVMDIQRQAEGVRQNSRKKVLELRSNFRNTLAGHLQTGSAQLSNSQFQGARDEQRITEH